MQTKFKDIAQYYLGTGLELKDDRFGFGHLYKLSTFNISTIFSDKQFSGIKPLLRSLDSLTKPIIVKGYNDGNEFVPIDEIKIKYPNTPNCRYILGFNYYNLSETIIEWCVMVLLLKWHFNVFGLEETEYIKID